MKLHFLTDSSTLVTLSIVDLAGYPSEDKRQTDPAREQQQEINQSLNYLLFVFRELMSNGMGLSQRGKLID